MTTPRLGFGFAALLVLQPVFATDAPAPATPVVVEEAEPNLTEWVQPEYPATALRQKLSGRADIEFVVTAEGAVTDAAVKDATDPAFGETALAAVTKWKFQPGLSESKPAAYGMGVSVIFKIEQAGRKRTLLDVPDGQRPHALPTTKASVKNAPDPDYPDELNERKLPGEVLIDFTVGPDGAAHAPKVLWASNAAFVVMSLRALDHTTFTSAHQGPLGKSGKMRYPVEFEMPGATREQIAEANHLTVAPDETAGVIPLPFVANEPVYPYEKLIANEPGNAVVDFSVNEKGRIGIATVVSASAPEFGLALRAAIESWMFRPVERRVAIIPVRLRCSYDFTLPSEGAASRVAAALRPGGAGIAGAKGLDHSLAPLWRGFPVYPVELREQGVKGSATIEFVIDSDGRSRCLRIVEASNEAFGWAAATAISQCVFESPRRKGEPVDVRVSIPVAFAPPND